MGWDGSGNYNRIMNWADDSDAGIKIVSDRHDQNDDDIAQAISNCLTKDGQSQPTNDIPMNGHKLIGLADPTLPTDATNKKYVDAIKTFATNLDLSGADANGRLNFTATTGINGITWAGADLSWLARLAGTPAGSVNRLVLNDKADGSGTDVISLFESGGLSTTGVVKAKTSFQVQADAGNAHLYFLGPSDVVRGILYTNAAAPGAFVLNVAAYGNYTFGATFTLPGGSYHDSNGNIIGTIWSNWGASDAYTAISKQIEARAQAWANAVMASCVTSTDCAGEVSFRRSGVTAKWQNSGYFFTGVQGDSQGGDAYYFARMPRRYIPNRGWEAAFPF